MGQQPGSVGLGHLEAGLGGPQVRQQGALVVAALEGVPPRLQQRRRGPLLCAPPAPASRCSARAGGVLPPHPDLLTGLSVLPIAAAQASRNEMNKLIPDAYSNFLPSFNGVPWHRGATPASQY